MVRSVVAEVDVEGEAVLLEAVLIVEVLVVWFVAVVVAVEQVLALVEWMIWNC